MCYVSLRILFDNKENLNVSKIFHGFLLVFTELNIVKRWLIRNKD